jgi:hypothetical protein
MDRALLKRSLIQVAVLFAAYYAIPPLVGEFLGPPVDSLSRYASLVVAALIAGVVIYKLFELRKSFASAVQVAVGKISAGSPASAVGRASDRIVLLTYLILITVIVLPIIDGFVSPRVLTIIKLVVVGYCLFLGYQLWNAFGSEQPKRE